MLKKKVERIKNNIVLSVKYSRLKEEISDTEKKKLELADKKKLIGSKEKEINKSNQFIEDANTVLEKIEQNNNPTTYLLVDNNQLKEQLKLLSKSKDFDLIKYGIAIEIIMDDDFKYTDNTNTDFIENISLMLFNDKSVMKKMEDDYKRIKNCIHGTNIKNYLESTAQLATGLMSKIPIKNLVKTSMYLPKSALVTAGTSALGIGLVYTYFKLRKKARKLSTLEPGDLANKLIINAMNLLYAKKHYEYKTDYNKYFKYTLREVNQDRKIIMKEMFENQYNMDVNELKIKLLHNFDDYLIEQMNLKPKKKGG
jgi:hypothetical protein